MTLKETLQKGTCLGAFLGFPSPEMVEILGLTGWDVVVADLEHGSMTRSDLAHLFRAADSVGIPAMVRVPENNPKTILGALDLGAKGIIVPMVNSVEEAEQAVASIHYPPKGKRGLAIGRAGNYGIDMTTEAYAESTQDIVCVVQIESREAVSNVKEIANIPGVDIVFVGPSDLSADYGMIGKSEDPEIQDVIKEVGKAIQESGKIGGIFCTSPDVGKAYIDQGYSFILTSVMTCVANGVKEFRGGVLE